MNEQQLDNFHTVRSYQIRNQKETGLTSAMEDYLEMIYRLCINDGCTRTGRVSEKLQVKPSSASKMISRLKQAEYLKVDKNGSILMTDKGLDSAKYLLYRHNTIEAFLVLLGIENTLEEAEQLEHTVTHETVGQLHKLLRFMQEQKGMKELWDEFKQS